MIKLRCNECGKIFFAKSINRWYCDDCVRIRSNRSAKRAQKRKLARKANLRMICGENIIDFVNSYEESFNVKGV